MTWRERNIGINQHRTQWNEVERSGTDVGLQEGEGKSGFCGYGLDPVSWRRIRHVEILQPNSISVKLWQKVCTVFKEFLCQLRHIPFNPAVGSWQDCCCGYWSCCSCWELHSRADLVAEISWHGDVEMCWMHSVDSSWVKSTVILAYLGTSWDILAQLLHGNLHWDQPAGRGWDPEQKSCKKCCYARKNFMKLMSCLAIWRSHLCRSMRFMLTMFRKAWHL